MFRPGYYDPFSERRVYTNQPPAHFRPMVDTVFPAKMLVVPIYLDRQGRLDNLSREFLEERKAEVQQDLGRESASAHSLAHFGQPRANLPRALRRQLVHFGPCRFDKKKQTIIPRSVLVGKYKDCSFLAKEHR